MKDTKFGVFGEHVSEAASSIVVLGEQLLYLRVHDATLQVEPILRPRRKGSLAAMSA